MESTPRAATSPRTSARLTETQWAAFEAYVLNRLKIEPRFSMGTATWREKFGYEMPHYSSIEEMGAKNGSRFAIQASKTVDGDAVSFVCSER